MTTGRLPDWIVGVVSFIHIAFCVLVVEYINNSIYIFLSTLMSFAVFIGVMSWMIWVYIQEESFGVDRKILFLWGTIISTFVTTFSLVVNNMLNLTWFYGLFGMERIVILGWVIFSLVYVNLFFWDIIIHVILMRVENSKYEKLVHDFSEELKELKVHNESHTIILPEETKPQQLTENQDQQSMFPSTNPELDETSPYKHLNFTINRDPLFKINN